LAAEAPAVVCVKTLVVQHIPQAVAFLVVILLLVPSLPQAAATVRLQKLALQWRGGLVVQVAAEQLMLLLEQLLVLAEPLLL
jgi:hypothetical protein